MRGEKNHLAENLESRIKKGKNKHRHHSKNGKHHGHHKVKKINKSSSTNIKTLNHDSNEEITQEESEL